MFFLINLELFLNRMTWQKFLMLGQYEVTTMYQFRNEIHIPFFNGYQGWIDTAEEFRGEDTEVSAPWYSGYGAQACTHPSVIQSPHPETIHSSGEQVAHGALELWPMVHLRSHILGFRHLHTVLWDLTATFWGRNVWEWRMLFILEHFYASSWAAHTWFPTRFVTHRVGAAGPQYLSYKKEPSPPPKRKAIRKKKLLKDVIRTFQTTSKYIQLLQQNNLETTEPLGKCLHCKTRKKQRGENLLT